MLLFSGKFNGTSHYCLADTQPIPNCQALSLQLEDHFGLACLGKHTLVLSLLYGHESNLNLILR